MDFKYNYKYPCKGEAEGVLPTERRQPWNGSREKQSQREDAISWVLKVEEGLIRQGIQL